MPQPEKSMLSETLLMSATLGVSVPSVAWIPNAMSTLPPTFVDDTWRLHDPMLAPATFAERSIVVSMLSDRLRFNVPLFVTDNPRPPGLIPAVTLHPGLQPALPVAWHQLMPVNNPSVVKPSVSEGTQKPLARSVSSTPGKTDVRLVKAWGVMRICAPPSIV